MLCRLPKGHDVNALHADGKGFFDMPHAHELVRISTCGACGVSSAQFDLSHKTLVSGGKDFRMANEGQDSQNEVIKVSQRSEYTSSNEVTRFAHMFIRIY
jgi:hypothetical protein